MKRILKSTLAVLLILTLVAGMSSVMALDAEKQYYDYGSYVLLGDSVASGWSDIEHRDSSFKRVEGSYGALLADDLGVTYHPMACIGFRTNDLRYMFEDDYDYESDRFLFYSIDKAEVDSRIPAIREAVANAGLVTLNIGGNDWGSYLGWHVVEQMDKIVADNEEFFTQARAYLEENGTAADTINSLIDIASLAGCLPELVQILPAALKEGFTTFFENWVILVEDIYALNPDVTLVAIGLFDSSLQDETMNEINAGNEGFDFQAELAKANFGQIIVDYANKPMRENAEKYGYIFVDPKGTLCEKQHPSYAGHRYIADLVLEALPHADFPYSDVELSSKYYRAVEYMWKNGIIDGASETEFAPYETITKGAIENAFAKLAGTEATSTDDSKAKRIDIIKAIITADSDATFKRKLQIFVFAVECFINNNQFDFLSEITKVEAAEILYDYINL